MRRAWERLREHGGASLEYVLITHVHLDHAGGAHARLLVQHPARRRLLKGAKYLVDPSRIVSLEDGGELRLGGATLRLVVTPGHASHSSAWYLVGNRVLFSGDSAGMLVVGEGWFVRPTAPPPFRVDMFLDSLSKPESLDPLMVCMPHYGCTRRARRYLRRRVDPAPRGSRSSESSANPPCRGMRLSTAS
ncbi:MAG: MBL fold metallo-hydrolase [Conexivisphaera sp.]